MTTRFSRLFAALSTQNRAALIPFVHLCDPTPEASLSILETLSDAGADAFVLGLAFSDPCADSPEMAESAKRALLAGSTAQRALEIIAAYRAEYPDTPLILRTYANLLFARGIDTFFSECRRAGVDAVLVPDIPVPMNSPDLDHDRAARENGIGFVLTAAPEDPAVTLKAAAERSHEAVLLTPSSGAAEAQTLSRAPAGVGQTPALIAADTPPQAQAAARAGAAGIVVENAFVRLVRENLADSHSLFEALRRETELLRPVLTRD